MVALFDNVTPFPVKQKDNEWFTPSVYIEAAREVMGGTIDLDPASCALANETVKAKRYYTKEDNGLLRDWTCSSMWLNPPYGRIKSPNGGSRSWQIPFTQKLEKEYRDGKVEQAVLLTIGLSCLNNWFEPFWDYPLCFQRKITFKRPDGTYSEFGFGSVFVYLGPNESTFVDIFSQFGTVAKRVSPARERPMSVRTLWDMEVQS